jgi:glycolate oxidase
MDKACSMPGMFSERDLETFARVRRAFDPQGICNPGKVVPTPRLCGEVPGPYRAHVLERTGVADRL